MAAEVKLEWVAPIIRTALATLEDKLPDQIAAYNAESENLIDLVVPAASFTGYVSGGGYVFGADDPLGVNGFPVIEAAITSGSGGPASVGLGGEGSEFDHLPTLNVVVWHEGDRGELPTTYEMSLGLARCVMECLLPNGALGGNVSPTIDAQSGRLAFNWRSEAIPADPTDDNREFRKWRVPVFIQLGLEHIDQFQAA